MARHGRAAGWPSVGVGYGTARGVAGPAGPPRQETATLKRVRQARRHEPWRLAHPYHPDVAVRIIVWFPDPATAVIALVGFDKARLGDVWYASAAARSEVLVDQWLREHEGGTR
jgi:hypothetical protein